MGMDGLARSSAGKDARTRPSGTLTYSYGTSNGLNDIISRLGSLTMGGTLLESYKYLGLSGVVERDEGDGVDLTYIGTSAGAAGDKYTGLDSFGRVVDQKWVQNGTDVKDEYVYTYDRDGNVVSIILPKNWARG